jgi:hypothetical protein
MKDIEQYKNRFFNLMESTMGDVKPLINEQARSKSVSNPQLVEKIKKGVGSFQEYGTFEVSGSEINLYSKRYPQAGNFQTMMPGKGTVVGTITKPSDFPSNVSSGNWSIKGTDISLGW